MTSFKDKTDQPWDVEITIGQLARVKSRCGVCLVDLTEEDRAAKRSEADLARLGGDVMLSVNMLYVLCEKQATARGLTDEQFGELLDMDAWADALGALQEELTVFTLPRSAKDRGRKVAQERSKQIMAATDRALSKNLDRLEKEPLTQAEAAEIERLIAGPGSASSTSPTNSPASSESTPPP